MILASALGIGVIGVDSGSVAIFIVIEILFYNFSVYIAINKNTHQ
jgi:hypothetical protein